MRSLKPVAMLVSAWVLASGAPALQAAEPPPKDQAPAPGKIGEGAEEFTATYVNLAGNMTSAQAFVHIDSYTTDQEVQELAGVLVKQGPLALRDTLSKIKKGWARLGGSLGYPLAVTRSKTTDSGRTVFIVTPRPLQGFSTITGSKAADYPFGLIELTLDKEGKGEGRLIGAAQIELKEGIVNVTSLGAQPVKLLSVRKR